MSCFKYLLIIAGWILPLGLLAQSVPFPEGDQSPKWEYVVWNFFGGWCEARTIVVGEKTTQCGQDYWLVYDCNVHAEDCHTLGFYRVEGDSVLVRPAIPFTDSVNCEEPEGLMYDFSTNVMDTLTCTLNYFFSETSFWKVGEMLVDYEGIERPTLDMNFYPYPNFPQMIFQMNWIRGVGSDVHPFYSFDCIGDHCEQELQLTRAYLDGELIYQDTVLQFSFPCEGWVNGTETVEPAQTSWKLLPNPVDDEFRLNAEGAGAAPIHVQVFSQQGRRMWQHRNYRPDTPIQTDSWPSGVYWVRLSDGKTVQTLKLIRI